MVFDYKIVPIRNEAVDSPSEIYGFSRRKKTVTRKLKKNRRKSTYDRRESVRDGVIVNLSSKRNRRKTRDRRHVSGERRLFGSGAIIVL
jgi:predicted RNA-binding protein